MFIGHLPAGYILTKKLQKKFKMKYFLFLGLLGSVLPDIDILYFYFIDNRQTLHHSYWIHTPFYWLVISVITFLLISILRKNKYRIAAIIFFGNIFLHLALDTIVGKIGWLYPFLAESYYLFNVPAVYGFWVYNFVFHWTFLLEVGAIFWAVAILFKKSMVSSRVSINPLPSSEEKEPEFN